MSFLYPLGLLGLIGVPILIIIYIIKSKYTEQTVASTYLWTLSERFLKRKNPVSRLTNIISLILQLLSVILISLIIAHPVITVPNAAHEYCFLLDSSGSMAMTKNGERRFDIARDKIKEKINSAAEGSKFSLITVAGTTTVIYDAITDKEEALLLLDECDTYDSSADFSDAIVLAQEYFNENTSLKTILFTDNYVTVANNVDVVNVSSSDTNFSISPIEYTLKGGTLVVKGNVQAHGNGANVVVDLYIDGATEPTDTQTIVAAPYLKTDFVFMIEGVKGFDSLRAVIRNSDSLSDDNETVYFNPRSDKTYSTLLVSDSPFFLETVLASVGNSRVEVVSTEEYSKRSGFGLYIFDSYTPEAMPTDGAVWLINPQSNLAEAGFSVQGEVSFSTYENLELSTNSAKLTKALTKNMSGKDIAISKYVKCGLYRNFTTVLSYKNNPVVFAGTNSYGNREVVLAFDLHNSNLPLLLDFIMLAGNLMSYSFPDVLDKTDYYAGEEVSVNLPANTTSVRIDTPDGNVSYLSTAGAVASFVADEAGSYTITVTASGNSSQYNVHAALPDGERVPVVVLPEFSLSGFATSKGFDGIYDELIILFIVLAVIFAADWGVYCYEKYQLR